jgi:hypothetical protein
MHINSELAKILRPAFSPCPAFGNTCSTMRWAPEQGHVPRGFNGATGAISEVELVLVFAEPGDPHHDEVHTGMESAYKKAYDCFETGYDQFHRNTRHILDSCWPGVSYEEQLRKVWMTESVLCSAKMECGSVPIAVARECGKRYLLSQLALFPDALVVALGSKAKQRLSDIGFTRFMPAYAVAPPGCNHRPASESWARIATELHRKAASERAE